jgi:hypothetical protein
MVNKGRAISRQIALFLRPLDIELSVILILVMMDEPKLRPNFRRVPKQSYVSSLIFLHNTPG